MSLFVVDKEKCSRCGACVAECPVRIIRINHPSPVPTTIDGADMMCINCGHCVAVCSHGALSHRAMAADECLPLRAGQLGDPERVGHYMRARRSIRAYKEKPVERDVLAELIDIARFAPSGHNGQPVRWLVIHDSDKVHQLAGLVVDWMRHMAKERPGAARAMGTSLITTAWDGGVDIICRGAPCIVVAHASKQNTIAQTDCAIALAHLELAAPAFGLGACWAGYAMFGANVWPPIQEFLGLPEGDVSYGMLMIGYPKHKYHRLPLRNEAQITWH